MVLFFSFSLDLFVVLLFLICSCGFCTRAWNLLAVMHCCHWFMLHYCVAVEIVQFFIDAKRHKKIWLKQGCNWIDGISEAFLGLFFLLDYSLYLHSKLMWPYSSLLHVSNGWFFFGTVDVREATEEEEWYCRFKILFLE